MAIYLSAPYFMGQFDPNRAGVTRHNWRILAPIELEADESTERMGILCQKLADEVAALRGSGQLPVVMAGDCTFSIGMVAGLQRDLEAFTLVWYDAHGDFNTHETTPSGFIGGMPLAMLTGRGEQTIMERAGAKTLPDGHIILTDARDLDPGEKEAVASADLIHLTDVADLDGYDLPDQPIYIHFDVDVLHLDDMPAVDYPADGGATLEAIEATLVRLAKTGKVAAISVSTWNPAKDDADESAGQRVVDLIERVVEQL